MNTVLVEKRLPSNQTIQIVQGDITAEEVDAIVNAANEHYSMAVEWRGRSPKKADRRSEGIG